MSYPRRSEVVAHLRDQIESGRWQEMLPPVSRLREELDCSREVVDAALRELRAEGLIAKRGARYFVSGTGGDARAVTQHRIHLIAELYVTGLTMGAFLSLSPHDQHALAGRSGREGYRRLLLAVDSFRSPVADVVRASLGHHETTRHAVTLTARRAAYAAAGGGGANLMRRRERRGAEELVGYLESLAILCDQGLIRDTGAPSEMTAPEISQALEDLETRTRRLERSLTSCIEVRCRCGSVP